MSRIPLVFRNLFQHEGKSGVIIRIAFSCERHDLKKTSRYVTAVIGKPTFLIEIQIRNQKLFIEFRSLKSFQNPLLHLPYTAF